MSTETQQCMTEKERKEHARLRELWATRKATKAQLLRCMELDRRADREALSLKLKERKA